MLGCWEVEQLEIARAGWRPDDPQLLEALKVIAGERRNFFGWDYVAGPWCYLLAERSALASPIPINGRLGFWTAEVDKDQVVDDAPSPPGNFARIPGGHRLTCTHCVTCACPGGQAVRKSSSW